MPKEKSCPKDAISVVAESFEQNFKRKKVQWKDEGLLLAVARHGEGSARLTVMTREHGLWNGLARANSRKGVAFPPVASLLQVRWSARLESHLGRFVCETVEVTAATLFDAPTALFALQSICALCQLALPERDPCRDFYESTLALIQKIDASRRWLADYLRWEHRLLGECGFGLDLSCCCATGSESDLAWLSPRTGRAVSRAGAETPLVAPYRARLLALPPALSTPALAAPALVLSEQNSAPSMPPAEWHEGLSVLGFFLNKCIDTLPTARLQLLDTAQRHR